VGFYFGDVVGGEFAVEDDDFCGGDERFFGGENLDALGGGVGALVKLPGKVFDGEFGFAFGEMEVTGDRGDLWFGEDELGRAGELGVVEAIDIIALDDAHCGEACDVEILAKNVGEFLGLGVEFGLFFDENAVHGKRNRWCAERIDEDSS